MKTTDLRSHAMRLDMNTALGERRIAHLGCRPWFEKQAIDIRQADSSPPEDRGTRRPTVLCR